MGMAGLLCLCRNMSRGWEGVRGVIGAADPGASERNVRFWKVEGCVTAGVFADVVCDRSLGHLVF
jgi:hypothetical protein